jgi:hypothetical protein
MTTRIQERTKRDEEINSRRKERDDRAAKRRKKVYSTLAQPEQQKLKPKRTPTSSISTLKASTKAPPPPVRQTAYSTFESTYSSGNANTAASKKTKGKKQAKKKKEETSPIPSKGRQSKTVSFGGTETTRIPSSNPLSSTDSLDSVCDEFQSSDINPISLKENHLGDTTTSSISTLFPHSSSSPQPTLSTTPPSSLDDPSDLEYDPNWISTWRSSRTFSTIPPLSRDGRQSDPIETDDPHSIDFLDETIPRLSSRSARPAAFFSGSKPSARQDQSFIPREHFPTPPTSIPLNPTRTSFLSPHLPSPLGSPPTRTSQSSVSGSPTPTTPNLSSLPGPSRLPIPTTTTTSPITQPSVQQQQPLVSPTGFQVNLHRVNSDDRFTIHPVTGEVTAQINGSTFKVIVKNHSGDITKLLINAQGKYKDVCRIVENACDYAGASGILQHQNASAVLRLSTTTTGQQLNVSNGTGMRIAPNQTLAEYNELLTSYAQGKWYVPLTIAFQIPAMPLPKVNIHGDGDCGPVTLCHQLRISYNKNHSEFEQELIATLKTENPNWFDNDDEFTEHFQHMNSVEERCQLLLRMIASHRLRRIRRNYIPKTNKLLKLDTLDAETQKIIKQLYESLYADRALIRDRYLYDLVNAQKLNSLTEKNMHDLLKFREDYWMHERYPQRMLAAGRVNYLSTIFPNNNTRITVTPDLRQIFESLQSDISIISDQDIVNLLQRDIGTITNAEMHQILRYREASWTENHPYSRAAAEEARQLLAHYPDENDINYPVSINPRAQTIIQALKHESAFLHHKNIKQDREIKALLLKNIDDLTNGEIHKLLKYREDFFAESKITGSHVGEDFLQTCISHSLIQGESSCHIISIRPDDREYWVNTIYQGPNDPQSKLLWIFHTNQHTVQSGNTAFEHFESFSTDHPVTIEYLNVLLENYFKEQVSELLIDAGKSNWQACINKLEELNNKFPTLIANLKNFLIQNTNGILEEEDLFDNQGKLLETDTTNPSNWLVFMNALVKSGDLTPSVIFGHLNPQTASTRSSGASGSGFQPVATRPSPIITTTSIPSSYSSSMTPPPPPPSPPTSPTHSSTFHGTGTLSNTGARGSRTSAWPSHSFTTTTITSSSSLPSQPIAEESEEGGFNPLPLSEDESDDGSVHEFRDQFYTSDYSSNASNRFERIKIQSKSKLKRPDHETPSAYAAVLPDLNKNLI